jgi:hydrogenase expression/formation protein HypE
MPAAIELSCPMPGEPDTIQLAHGSGGRWMNHLLDRIILPAFRPHGAALEARHDGAILPATSSPLAITTDSYVIRPLFFPGGDIGRLAIYGSVNDLAMCGARAGWMSVGLILEEGLPLETLRRILASMAAAAEETGVAIVTGDTKVVERGKGDGIYVNTTAVGSVLAPALIAPSAVRPGDAVVINGDLGRHGMAVLSVREGLEFDGDISSDLAPLWRPVECLLQAGIELHCLRDLTRGGLSSALNEIAQAAHLGIRVRESAIPIHEAVRGACEILGLDPLYVANEGRFAAFVPARLASEAAAQIGGVIIGEVVDDHAGMVVLETAMGVHRPLDLLSGEQLPRIC